MSCHLYFDHTEQASGQLIEKYLSHFELTIPTYQIENFDEASNDELLALEIDLLEER